MDTNTTHHTDPEPSVQQLTLLPPAEVPVQFRLDADTRRRGMRHVAEIRQLLEQRRLEREATERPRRPARRADRAA